jgi:hypothetical protein
MNYKQIRSWGIVMILGISFLSGCTGATPTPAIIVPASTPTSLPPQPPAALPTATGLPPTVPAQPTVATQSNGTELTATADGTLSPTPVLPTVNPIDQPFLMRIDRVSVVVGRGILLEGRVAHGTLQGGAGVEILGSQDVVLNPVVLAILISNTVQNQVTVGDYAGLLVQGIEVSEVSPGMLLAESGAYNSFEDAIQQLQ